VSFPKIFGKGVSDSINVIWTAAPKRIATSLPINIINMYKGIYELSQRNRIVPDNNNLSATGSNIVPRYVCQFIFLARNPSKASVKEAIKKYTRLIKKLLMRILFKIG
jgi:hypothetical protein